MAPPDSNEKQEICVLPISANLKTSFPCLPSYLHPIDPELIPGGATRSMSAFD